MGPTRPAGLALVLGSAAGEWSQAGSEPPVGCSEWPQDLKGCGLEGKFSLRKSQSVEPGVCGSELKWTPCWGAVRPEEEWQDGRGPRLCRARARSPAVGRALRSAPVG